MTIYNWFRYYKSAFFFDPDPFFQPFYSNQTTMTEQDESFTVSVVDWSNRVS